MKKIMIDNSFLASAAQILTEGKSVRLRISGSSMFPFVRGAEDEVELVPINAEEELPMWSAVLFVWEGEYMIHRLVGKKGKSYVFMGDGNLSRKELVVRSQVFGILKTIYRPSGEVVDCMSKKWLSRGKCWNRLRLFRKLILLLYK